MMIREGTMRSAVFWDVTRCCLAKKNRHFGGTWLANRLLRNVDKLLPGYTMLHTIRWHCLYWPLQKLKSDTQCGIFTVRLTVVSTSFQDYAYTRSNFAFSPYGVASVLVVLYEGARGESARQIHNTLRLPWNVDVTRIGFRDIHRHLRVSTFVMGPELRLYPQLTGVRACSQAYDTEKRTAVSPTAWTPPQEILEWSRTRCKLSLTADPSVYTY